jgi:hypothetical protein
VPKTTVFLSRIFKRKKRPKVNLLECVPERNYLWETGEDGLVVVLIPRFQNAFLARWLQPKLKRPYLRLSLDEHGSFLWNQCDGKTSIREMAVRMQQNFGRDFDPDCERISKFVVQLIRGDMITLKNLSEETEQ